MILSATIKPEIYISWIPIGKIYLKPEIYATYIPEPEKATADLSRKVVNSTVATADLERKVAINENFPADLLRNVVDTEKFSADTMRKTFVEEIISADTFRCVVQNDKVKADTYREVKDTEKIIADTSRKIGLITVHSDLLRKVNVTTKATADTRRQVGISEKCYADTYLKIGSRSPAVARTYRKVTDSERLLADTLIKIGGLEKVSADTARIVANREKTFADTFLKLANTEKVIADLRRGLRDFVRVDTFRQVTRSEKTFARTVIQVPYIMRYVVQPKLQTLKKSHVKLLSNETPFNVAPITSTLDQYGATAINIILNERTLSDEFRFDITTSPIINSMPNIGEAISGAILDYYFNCIVEETNQTELVMSIIAKYKQEDLLYTWLTLKDIIGESDESTSGGDSDDSEEEDSKPSAIKLVKAVAFALGFKTENTEILIDDFKSSNIDGNSAMTYADLISNLFSWTSRVPQRQVNVFIRGDKFYCIQRGKENKNATFDITNLPHSRPTINKKIVRVLCNNPANTNDIDGDDTAKPFSGTISYSMPGIAPYQASVNLRLSYNNGLLLSEHLSTATALFVNENDEIVRLTNASTTQYSYEQHYQQYYLSSKRMSSSTVEQNMETLEVTRTTTDSSTTYGYSTAKKGEIYLFHEQEQIKQKEESSGDTTTTGIIRDTYHAPAGNGFYAQTIFQNGILQGANLSQGKPGNAVSQYTIDQFQQSFYTEEQEPADEDSDQLSMIEDDSFPVDSETKEELNAALRNLHGKTAKTVTVDLISRITNGVPEITHIVDFTGRVILDGEEYYLVSNNISFTSRKLIQKLQLIRWEGL